VFQDVMSNNQIVTCFYCNRILYFVPPPPRPEDEAKAAKAGAAAKAAEEEEPVQTDEAAG
jgi:hypothetical protein